MVISDRTNGCCSSDLNEPPTLTMTNLLNLTHTTTRRAEGRDQPGGIPRVEARVRTQSRAALPPNLARVNAAAQQAAQTRFTALLHHVDIAAIERAFRRQKRLASAGVDGMTVAAYEQDLEANLRDLWISAPASTRAVTGHSRFGVSTSRKPMAGSARSACRLWRTRSFRVQSPSFSAPSTRSISSASPTASGQDGTRIWLFRRCIRR